MRTGHIKEHCATPRISRTWKKLGRGAVWACDCGKVYRLVYVSSYAADGYIWQWKQFSQPRTSAE